MYSLLAPLAHIKSPSSPNLAPKQFEDRGGTEADLFGRTPPRYPNAPGFKVAGTSLEAAVKIAPHAETVRKSVLAGFCAAFPGGMTADECAKLVDESILTARPRVTELYKAGLLEQTTERRENESGHNATVWRASRKAMERAQ